MAKITMDYEDLQEILNEKYIEGCEEGESNGFSFIMNWLKSGKSMYDYLLEMHRIGTGACRERLKEMHWFRIEDMIKTRILDAEIQLTAKLEKEYV